MKLCKKFYRATIVLVVLILAFEVDVFSQSERGIHYTPEEVAIWRQRMVSGPYRNAGDVSANSPGDWARIKQNADDFLANPSKDRFYGGDDGVSNIKPYTNHINLRDAAFVYLLTKERKYFDAVKKELLAQIQIPATDPSTWKYIGDMGRWYTAEWIARLLFAYDYIKTDLTSIEKAQLDQWFLKAGVYFKNNTHESLVLLFPNRTKEDYSVKDRDAQTGLMRNSTTHVNKDGSKGNTLSYLSSWYNNRRSAQIRTAGMIGAFYNDKDLIFHIKLYIKEMLMFSTYPDGTMGEYNRNGNYGNPQAGMTYSSVNVQTACDIADVLARKGDYELYNYTTSKGLWGTEGGNKNIKLLVENYYRQTDLSVERFYQSVDIKNRIDSEQEFGGTYGIERWVNDIWYTMSNVYWKSDYHQKVYMRKVGPPYPSKNLAGAGPIPNPWGGLGGSYPGILFMFGQMEGKVWPYPTVQNPISGSITAPSSLSATASSSTEIKLNWKDNSDNEANFVVEVSNSSSSGFAVLKELGANVTTFTHTGLTAGVTRYYRVMAKNSAGNSSYSNLANATTTISVPTAPSTLAASAVSTTEIKLDWKDNSNNETNFVVEVSNSSSSGFTVLKELGANVTTFTHTGLTAGVTRYYRVMAKNSAGNSSYSNVASATTAISVPTAPSTLAASAVSTTEIKLDWKDNSNNETNFVVEVSNSSSSGFAVLKELGANVTTFSHTGLTAGVTRYYRVMAKNSAGNSGYSNIANATTNVNIPSSPSELVATTISTSEIKLDWKDNSNNETNFVLEVSNSSTTGFTVLKEVGANVTSFSHTGLQAGITRYYRVLAKNSAGTSSYSNVIKGTTNINVPATPSELNASGASMNEIRLSWKDNCNTESAFVIEVSSNSNSGFTTLKEVSANTTSFNHAGLQAGATRYYRVLAKNSSGNSKYSNIANATTLQPTPVAPAAPSNLAATGISGNMIELKWADKSTNESKFVIEFSTSSNGNFVHLADVTANTTSYFHTDLNPNQTFYYRVKAENSTGSSNFTTVVKGTSLCTGKKPDVYAKGSPSFCQGQSIDISASSGYVAYEWQDGRTSQYIMAETSGSYSVKGLDDFGCWSAYSDPVNVEVYMVTQPEILIDKDSIYTNMEANHQWALNNKPIHGAIENYYIPIKTGFYSVTITDENGCTAQSEKVRIDDIRNKIVKVFPNPNNGTFKIEIDNPENLEYEMVVYSSINETIVQKRLVNFNDKNIMSDIDIRQYGSGIYLVRIYSPGSEPIIEKILVK